MVKSDDEPNTVAVNKDSDRMERGTEIHLPCVDRQHRSCPCMFLGSGVS